MVYDADCGPCRRFKRAVELLDRCHRFAFVSLRDADANGNLNAVPPRLRYRSFHLISPDGEVLSGANALPALASMLPSGRVVSKAILSTPGGLKAAGFAYGVLSRLHDSGSCKRAAGRDPVLEVGEAGESQLGPEERVRLSGTKEVSCKIS